MYLFITNLTLATTITNIESNSYKENYSFASYFANGICKTQTLVNLGS